MPTFSKMLFSLFNNIAVFVLLGCWLFCQAFKHYPSSNQPNPLVGNHQPLKETTQKGDTLSCCQGNSIED